MTGRVIAMLLLWVSNPALQSRPDLSGSWVAIPSQFNLTKAFKAPDPHARPAPPPPPAGSPLWLSIRLTHDEPVIELEYLRSDGTTISRERRTTDNTENLNQRDRGALIQHSKTHWADGALVTESRLMREDATILSAVESWQLSPDGTTLTITSSFEDSKSLSHVVAVYRRKP